MRLLLSLCLASLLAGCGVATTPPPTSILPPPAAVADRTKVDEQAGLTFTLAYTAAAKAASLAIQTGLVKDKVTISKIGEANAKGIAAVDAVRAAYLAGNSDNYADALKKGQEAVAGILALIK